jgi:beta-xylosidase
LKSFVAPPKELIIIDQDGERMQAGSPRAYFEGPSINKISGLYYLSYSTGPTHTIDVAVSESRTGPFVWNSTLLEPVAGWTTHSSIINYQGTWWLYYADASLSGQDNLRNTKARELVYKDGTLSLKQPQPVVPKDDAKKRSVSRRHAMEFAA